MHGARSKTFRILCWAYACDGWIANDTVTKNFQNMLEFRANALKMWVSKRKILRAGKAMD